MAATRWASRAGRFAWVVLGLLGLFLTVDVLLAYGFAVLVIVSGGPVNPYIGIVLFLVLPMLLAVGVLTLRWAWHRLSFEEVGVEAAVRGH